MNEFEKNQYQNGNEYDPNRGNQNFQNTENTQYTTPNPENYIPKYENPYHANYQSINNPESTYMEDDSNINVPYQPIEASFREVPVQSYESYGNQPSTPKSSPKRKGGKGSMFVTMALVALLAGGVGGAGTYMAVGAKTTQSTSTVTTAGIQTNATSPVTTGTVADVAATASSSVVEITTTTTANGKGIFGQTIENTSEGAGSGVIISEDGYIVTNNHVVEGAGTVKVRLTDGKEYDAEVVGVDSQTDLAVLKINASGLNAATFGDSNSLVVGQEVVAIGNPLGTLGGTVTDGIISATNRSITIENETMNLIQTTAAINPGNSGGGLFNSAGQLIGIVNAKSSGTGIEGLGFAIPSNDVQEVVSEIIKNGYVTGRVKMGLSLVEVPDAQTAMMYGLDNLGVYIAEDSGDAQSADLIKKVDGQEVSSIAEIKSIIEKKSVGDKLTLTILRDGKEQNITLTLQEQTPTVRS